MLFIAEKLNMSLAEVAVNWTEIEGKYISVQSENYFKSLKQFTCYRLKNSSCMELASNGI